MKDLGDGVDEEIRTRTLRGETPGTVHAALLARGVSKVSLSTVKRRAALVEPATPSVPTYPLTEPDEDEEEGAPEDDPLFGTYDGVLRDVERLGRLARANSNLGLLARCEALKISALEAKRKAAPPEVPDPNEAIDMIAAAKRARDTLHRLIVTSPEDG
jgi:hypothetical protein